MRHLGYIRGMDDALRGGSMLNGRNTSTRHSTGGVYMGETGIAEKDYSNDIINYINTKYAAEFTLGEDEIDSLNPRQLVSIVLALEDYVRERNAANEMLPEVIHALVVEARAEKERLAEYEYLREHIDEENPQQLLDGALRESGIAAKAYAYIDDIGEQLSTAGTNVVDALSYIVRSWQGLDENVRDYFAESGDAKLAEFSGAVAYMETLQFEGEKKMLGDAFLSPGNAMTVAQFVEARAKNYSDARKAELAAFLNSLHEKKLYNEMNMEGALLEYLDSRNLNGKAYDEMKRYGLIDRYCDIVESGYTDKSEPLFEKYLRYRDLEAYIAGASRLEGEDDGAFAERIAAEFKATHGEPEGETYAGFAEDYFAGNITSVAYLPEEVRLYVASNDYYDGVFLNGLFLRNGNDINDFITKAYGSASLGDAVRAALVEYIGGFKSIDTYYGEELRTYLAKLTPRDQGRFRQYYYLSGVDDFADVLRPGFDDGIYGLGRKIAADLTVFGGMTEEILGALLASHEGLYMIVARDAENKKRATDYARSLVALRANPGLYASFRNYIIQVSDDANNEIITAQIVNGEEYIDRRNAETGMTERYCFMPEEERENGASMLGSLIAEEANNPLIRFACCLLRRRRKRFFRPATMGYTV